MTKVAQRKSLSETANEILRNSAVSNQEPFGVGKGNNPHNPEDMGGDNKVGSPYGAFSADFDKTGINLAKNAGPRATPPGKVGLGHGEDYPIVNKDSKEPEEVADEGGWDEDEDENVEGEEKGKLAEEDDGGDHSNFEKDTEDSEGTYDSNELQPDTGDAIDPNAHPDIPDAKPVSDKVKEYFDRKDALEPQAVKEDIAAIFAGENFSAKFVKKATQVYEAAVTAAATKVAINICEEIEDQYVSHLETVTEAIKNNLTEQVDDYLNYVVEGWVKDNEVAIERGIRAELTEDFIAGLRNLFVEHYIDIPEEKVDVVEELASQVEELNNRINEEIARGVSLNKELNELRKMDVIHTVTEGLKETQIQKLKNLAESVEYTTEEEYKNSLETLRESYYPTKKVTSNVQQLDEVSVEGDDRSINDVTDEMSIYARAISRTNKPD